jgi:hypothetical protein
VGEAAGGPAEDPYRTLRLRPGASRGEVKKAFCRLTLVVRTACVRAQAQPLLVFPASAPAPLALLWHPNYPFHFHPDVSTTRLISLRRRARACSTIRTFARRRRGRAMMLAAADEQHEGGRRTAGVLAAQVQPRRRGSRPVQYRHSTSTNRTATTTTGSTCEVKERNRSKQPTDRQGFLFIYIALFIYYVYRLLLSPVL